MSPLLFELCHCIELGAVTAWPLGDDSTVDFTVIARVKSAESLGLTLQ